MTILQQTMQNGFPSPAAMFVNAVLSSALYHEDRRPFDQYASMIGGAVSGFDADRNTFRPDRGVIVSDNDALVILDGTTNIPQWLAHAGSAFFPAYNSELNNTLVASFEEGYSQVRRQLDFEVTPAIRGRVVVSGHSYGAGCAKIYCDVTKVNFPSSPNVQLMTFGEPKSTGDFLGNAPTYQHLRICSRSSFRPTPDHAQGFDPVTFVPPGILLLPKIPFSEKIALKFLQFSWRHFGVPFELTNEGIANTDAYGGFLATLDALNWIDLLQNLPYISQHYMDTSYLPKTMSLWRASGLNPELSALVPFVNQYLGNPFVPAETTGPPIPAAMLGESFGFPAGAITDANRTDFAVVSASARVVFGSSVPMPAPIIPLTLKGTLFANIDEGGVSQSFYANSTNSAAPTTLVGMINSLNSLVPFRTRLSMTKLTPRCSNPLTVIALRSDDTTTKRKTLLNTNVTGSQVPYPAGAGGLNPIGQITNDNDETNVAVKVTFTDNSGNTAIQYFHGVPLLAYTNPAGGVQAANVFDRFPYLEPSWIQTMYNFCNQLNAQGLGLRYATVQWTPNMTPVGPIAATGNGTPIEVYYSYPGTPVNTYTFSMPVGSWNLLGKFRVILREFKNLRVINKRWPALGWVTAGNYYVNVNRRAANYLPWDGTGYLSPEVWSVMTPNSCPPLTAPLQTPGVVDMELTTKKAGRPFGEQRGRARAMVV